ncbi:unnamed protein product [Allacma fusca]|uniref:Uncharacterized protein n=1 Tax=Allacma fusca TaxID=39272 RepID=A0A8J2K2L3_9HEXA|nr:unnamed protein product [Allacma fusca]
MSYYETPNLTSVVPIISERNDTSSKPNYKTSIIPQKRKHSSRVTKPFPPLHLFMLKRSSSAMDSKFLYLLMVLALAFQAQAAPGKTLKDEKIRDARQSVDQANTRLQQNLISTLASLANVTAEANANVSRSANVLMRELVTNWAALAGVFAYMPRLILMDGPTQFVETLKLIRSNQIRFPNDVDSAIDTLIAFANQQRDSGIGSNFTPLVTFLPNLFTGFEKYLTTFIDSVFNVIAN